MHSEISGYGHYALSCTQRLKCSTSKDEYAAPPVTKCQHMQDLDKHNFTHYGIFWKSPCVPATVSGLTEKEKVFFGTADLTAGASFKPL